MRSGRCWPGSPWSSAREPASSGRRRWRGSALPPGAKAALRAELLAHVGRLGPTWLTRARSGELTALATTGLDALDGYFGRYLPQVVLAVLAPVAVLAWVLPADPVAGLTILVTLPLIPVFMVLVGRTTERLNRHRTRLLGRLAHFFLDVVAGLGTLRVFGRTAAVQHTIERSTEDYRRATMATLRLAFLSSLVLELLATLSVALVAVGIGLRLVGGALDLRTALFVLILAPEAYLPLRMLATHYHASAEGLAAAADVFAVLDAGARSARPAPGLLARRLPSSLGRYAPSLLSPDAGGPEQLVGDQLILKGVTVRYPGTDRPVLEDFSLTVAPGEVVALAGPSGCGKSTVLGVVLGLVPVESGRVVAPPGLAWVPQRPYLFAGTVAENVRLGVTVADADVQRALAAAGADSFVDSLEMAVDERGRGLSAGQRQRIALARAFARDAAVLLLDEPTSFLDPAAEAEVIAAIRAAACGRTVLIAAHRPSLLALADRVVRLDHLTVAAP